MNSRLRVAVVVLVAACVASAFGQAGNAKPKAKKHHVEKPAEVPMVREVVREKKGPTVEEQINELRQQMQSQQSQIDSLKTDLAAKDAQLKQAQQDAADAHAQAVKAQEAADQGQQAVGANTQAVTALQSTVTDLKANALSLAATVSDETAKIKKEIANPDAIHFKGATLSFTGSFLAAETVNRTAATGGDINTPFTGVPLQNSEAYQLSEFYGSGRQSRLAFKALGKRPTFTLTGYYEMDWLSAGVTSNNNQSNSYTLRQRQLWADAKTDSGWDFSGGQGWSLAAETTKGLTRGTEILPATIDAQYEAGFVWTRQYSFRMSKDFGKSFFLGASVENAETLNPAGANLPTNILIGSAGTGGGLYNLNANYSFNYAPDFVLKMAVEPGWGHFEVFGIQRTFRDRIYPGESCTSSGCTGSTTGAYNDTEIGAGIGGGFRGPLFDKKVTVGLKGLWGQGVGRYGSSTIADVTIKPNGILDPLHGFSALSTIELNPTPRFMAYFNYGGDYIGREYLVNSAGKQVGYGTPTTNMSGCLAEPVSGGASFPSSDPTAPGNCGGNNKDVQEYTAGYWYYIQRGPMGGLRQGFQYSYIRRDLWSGAGSTTNPGNGAFGGDNMFFTSLRYYLP